MKDFNVIERNTDYFKCTTNGMHCRIIIDKNSEKLTLGIHKLHVEEISDRYLHHGKDSVFRLTLPLSEQSSIEICTLKPGKKNNFLYKACLKLGGKWEPILNEWVFSASVQDKVEQLQDIINSDLQVVEVEFKETISMPSKKLSIFGFELVKGLNIDHSPIFHPGISLKKGNIAYIVSDTSKTVAIAGTKVRLSVPNLMIDNKNFREDYFSALSLKLVKNRNKKM